MARNFNIVTTLQLRGPNNIRSIVSSIQKAINSVNANVNINIGTGVNSRLNTLNNNLNRVNTTLLNITKNAGLAASQLQALAAAITSVRSAGTSLNVTTNVTNKLASNIAGATANMHAFGEQAALAVRRFAAFAGPTAVIFGLIAAIKEGFSAAFEFEKEMIRLSQVTGKSVGALGDLSREITRLATGLGTSSKDLGNIATTLAQAGLSAKDTKTALEALARSSLAATFTDIENTTEGAIAVFRQFGVQAGDLQGVIGSLNAVSAAFAAESDDLVSVIRRTGGAFKAAGGNLNELLGLFTAVRSTTRESADSIATGFRTIFTRIQRPRTIQYLKELGINLTDVDNRFIGPLESVRRLNAALSQIETNDPRFSAIIEELGGFRQVSKVIPLIQQFPEALKAISVAQQGQLSIVEDSEIAQKSLANQLTKVREEFFALFREITADKSFRVFAETSLDLARSLIEITRSLKPLIPLLGALAVLNAGKNAPSFASGFLSGLGRTKKFAKGGFVPGSGSGDTVPAMLTPGEFVLRKDVAQSIGKDELNKFNRFAKGGKVDRQSRLNKAVMLPGVMDFGLAALNPVGAKESGVKKVPFNVGGKTFGQDVKVSTAGLSKDFAVKAEKYIQSNLVRTSTTVARKLLGDIGAAPNEGVAKHIVGKAGFTAAVGSVFESALGIAGAPYTDKPVEGFPIDFPRGLGSVASAFGLNPNIPTDATRTAGSKGKSLGKYLGQIERYLAITKQTDPTVQALIGKSSGMPTASAGPGLDIGASLAGLKGGDVDKLRKTFLEGRRVGGGVDGILKKMGVTKSEFASYAATKKFAKGGSAGGDTVPALLTPGEFVLNKESVDRFGVKNLQALNNTKVKKFAKGGAVGNPAGGSGFSGAGAFFAISAITSLTSTFDTLDDKSKKLLNSIAALAIAVPSLSFLVKGAADEDKITKSKKLGKLLQFDFANPARSQTAQRRLGLTNTQANLARLSGTMAKNFDTIAISSAGVAAGLNFLGDILKNQAQEMAASAKTIADVNSAIAKDNQGALAKGVGTGAGVGALVGTLIAPGIGTAIGTVAGGLIGTAITPFFADTEAIVKSFKQNQFDKVGELLSAKFDDLNSGKFNLNSRATGIGASLAEQRKNTFGAADTEQRKELAKQFRAEINNIQSFGSKIADTVRTIEEFESAFGGAGRETINTLSFLTKKTYGDVRKAIEEEIKSLVSAKDAQEALRKSSKDFAGILIGISAFSEAIQRSADSVNELAPAFDSLVSSISGGVDGGKFAGTNGITSSFFERASGGKISSEAAIKSNIKQITDGLIDDASKDAINKAVLDVSNVARELPGILDRTSSRVGFGEDSDDVESIFQQELKNVLPGLSKDVTSVLGAAFAAQVASRTGTGDAGFKQELRKDPQAIIDKILGALGPDSIKALDGAIKIFQDQINTLSDRVATSSKLELEISKKRVDLERTKFEFESNLVRDGGIIGTGRARAAFGAQQSELLTGTGVGGGAAEIGAALKTALDERQKLEVGRQSAPFAEQGRFIKEIGAVSDKANRLRSALENLAGSTLVLSNLQAQLAKEEDNRNKRASLTDDLIFGGGEGRVEFARVANALKGITEGKFGLGELPLKMRDEVRGLLGKLPDAESGLLGGITPTDFLERERGKELARRGLAEGAAGGAADDIFGLTKRGGTKESPLLDAIRAEQAKMVGAQEILNKLAQDQVNELKLLNTTTLDGFSKSIIDAVNEIGAAAARSKVSSLENAVLGKKATSGEFNKLATILNPAAAGADFASGPNAAIGNSLFAQGKAIEAFSKEIEAAKAADKTTKSLANFPVALSKLSSVPNSKEFGLGQTQLTRSEASQKAVNAFIEENDLNKVFPDTLPLIEKLKSSLDKTATTNGEAIGGTGNTPEDRVNKFKNQDEFAAIVKNRLIKALAEFRAEALSGSEKVRNTNLAPVRERFGKELTDSLLKDDNFEQVTRATRNLSQEMGNAVDPATRLVDQIRNLRTEIDGVKAGPFPTDKKAGGGAIRGPGTGTSDSILARLSTGEFVVRAAAVNKLGVGTLNHINATGSLPGFAGGGATDEGAFFTSPRKQFLAKRREAFLAAKAARKTAFNKTFKKAPARSGGPGKPFMVFGPGGPGEPTDALGGGRAAGAAIAARSRGGKTLSFRTFHGKGITPGFATGGIVRGAVGLARATGLTSAVGQAAAGGQMTLSPQALGAMSEAGKQFGAAAGVISSAMNAFAPVGQALSSALTNWTATANKLAEAMLSMPTEINVVHSPVVVTANITGIEGLEKTIQDKVLAVVDARLGAQTARAADGKSPFFTSTP